MNFVITLILCLLSYNMCSALKLSIFYETLCGDSIMFFRKQLQHTFKKIGPALQIEFVPYGRVDIYPEEDGKVVYHCQHGRQECYGNKLHACVLAQNHGQDTDVNMLVCAMKRSNPASSAVVRNCANTYGVDFKAIKKCADGDQGEKLFQQHGERTTTGVPKLPRVPALMINNDYNIKLQRPLEFKLLETVCSYLEPKPDGCY